jgi:hypothetical protein
MKSNMRCFRVESLVSNSPVIAELEVVKEDGDLLIVRTFSNYYKRLVKANDKSGLYYKTYDLTQKEEVEWLN